MQDDDFEDLFAQAKEDINLISNDEFMTHFKATIHTPEQLVRVAEVFVGMDMMLERLLSGEESN